MSRMRRIIYGRYLSLEGWKWNAQSLKQPKFEKNIYAYLDNINVFLINALVHIFYRTITSNLNDCEKHSYIQSQLNPIVPNSLI